MHFEILTQKKKLQLICFDDLILWSDLLSLMKIWCSFCFWRRELWGLLNYRSKFQKHFLLLWCGQNLKREKVFVNASDVVEDWSSSRKLGWLLRLETPEISTRTILKIVEKTRLFLHLFYWQLVLNSFASIFRNPNLENHVYHYS